VGSLDSPTAWISLDQYDNDLNTFLGYFIAAIQSIYPQKLTETQSLLGAPELPPLRYLTGSLINELNEIEDEYVLVLDDYYLIELQDIHDLVSELIQYTPKGMHLILCTRMDPPLPLVKLRAKSRVVEIRGQDLCFTEEEAYSLLQNILGPLVDSDEANKLLEQSEGWVTGIRLAALALRHRKGKERVAGRLSANNRYVMEYLVSEILENQVAVFSEGMLKTSILEHMSPGLCEAVCNLEYGSEGTEFDGRVFLDWLDASNLFVIHMDDQSQWVRYHYLFQDSLQRELARRFSTEEIAALHCRASAWYEIEGLIEEALHHALAADDGGAATKLVVAHRHEPMNQENWNRLQRWLNLLPEDAIAKNADLLLAQAWVLNSKFRFEEVFAILEQVQNLIDEKHASLIGDERSILEGEMAALRCIPFYWVGQGQLSLDSARLVVEVTPSEHEWVRGIGLTYMAGAYQMVGQLDTAYNEMHKILTDRERIAENFVHRAYITYLAVELLAGNLSDAKAAALRLMDISQPRKLYDSLGWALYTCGYVSYQRNETPQASRSFSKLVEMRYQAHAAAAAQGFYGLALCHQALGKFDEAQQTIQDALAWASETGNSGMLNETNALSSRLVMMQGHSPDTTKWAGLISEAPPVLLLLNIPHLTLANILAVEGTSTANVQARDLLAVLRQFAEFTHATCRMMEITAIEALLKASEGDHEGALILLEQVIDWSEPHGYIRLFIDMGPKMAELLDRLHKQGDIISAPTSEYIAKILKAFESERDRQTPPTPPSSQLVEQLTNRESEILTLLGERLTNKEIAAQLHISVGTVEQHLVRIYGKLGVRGRRQAATKAEELGLLPTR
jgi:LuxR family maltose regulon positive regulatory protein